MNKCSVVSFLVLFTLLPFQAKAVPAPPITFVEPEEGVPSSYIEKLIKGEPHGYFQEINSGWPKELYESLSGKLEPGKSYIVIHNRLPYTPIDLRTAENFKLSMLAGKLADLPKMDLGHVILGWHCDSTEGVTEGVTGFTGELNHQSMAMIKSGWGFSALFSLYNDGHLQTPKMVNNVMRAKKLNHLVSLAVEVDAAACRQVTDFVAEYVNRADKPYRHFGLNADPAKFQGAGCGSFAVTAASKTDLFGGIFSHFWRELSVNSELMGYGLKVKAPLVSVFAYRHAEGTAHHVNLFDLLFKNWNANRGPALRVMDPEMLYLFQQTIFKLSLGDVSRENSELGRKLAASPYLRNRVIKGTIFRRQAGDAGAALPVTKIDEHFDERSHAVVLGAKSWLATLKQTGYSAKAFEYNGRVGVLLTR